MEKNTKKECLYAYKWVTLLYSRDWHNIVNQLYFNKNKKQKTVERCLRQFHGQGLEVRVKAKRVVGKFLHWSALIIAMEETSSSPRAVLEQVKGTGLTLELSISHRASSQPQNSQCSRPELGKINIMQATNASHICNFKFSNSHIKKSKKK